MEKVISIPRRITRDFIKAHSQYHFLYSTSYLKTPNYGQSKEAHNLVNTTGIPLRYSLCQSSGYFSDNIKTIRNLIIQPALDRIPSDKIIIPFPRMGEGRSRFKEFCIGHWTWLMEEIDRVKYHNIEYV